MLLTVDNAEVYCYTGGKPIDAALPCAVFIHGAQNDHSVWALQSRYFAHHGFNVLALDLPGHGRSQGPARSNIGSMSHWLLALLDAAGVRQAILIGHSMGTLIALHTAHLAPQRVSHLALLCAAYPMAVSQALLAAAQTDEAGAFDMVNIWSHTPPSQKLTQTPMPAAAHKSSFPGPGFYAIQAALRLKQHLARINPAQLLHNDFSACNAYADGVTAAASVRCPTLFICGKRDQMTPPKAVQLLTSKIAHAKVVQMESGHEIMAEQADAVLDTLFSFASEKQA